MAPTPRAPTPAPTPVPAQSAAAASTSRPSPVFMSAPFWRFASVMVGVGASAAVLFLAVVLLGPVIQHNLPSISVAHTPKRQAVPTAVPTTAPVVAPTAAPTSAPTVAPTRAPVPTAVISTAPRTTSVPAQTSDHSWTFPPLKTSGGQPELALFNPNASTVNARVRIIRAGHVDTRRVRISAGGIVRIPLTAAEVRPGGGPTDTLTVRTTAAIVPMRVVVGQSSGTTG